MVKAIFLVVIGALLVLPMAGQAFPGSGPVPTRPLDGIFDPEGWLEESIRAAMVRKILNARGKQSAQVFVVVLPERPSDERRLAARWGAEWGQDNLWGVLLHVPGETGFPLFEADLARSPDWNDEQKAEFERSLDEALAKVRRRSKVLPGEREQVARGAADLADELGYLSMVMRRMARHNAQARGDRAQRRSGQEEQGGRILPTMIVIGSLGGLSLLILFLLFRKSGEGKAEVEEGPIWFPETIPRKRFRAPWSGGGNVLVAFRREDQSPRR